MDLLKLVGRLHFSPLQLVLRLLKTFGLYEWTYTGIHKDMQRQRESALSVVF